MKRAFKKVFFTCFLFFVFLTQNIYSQNSEIDFSEKKSLSASQIEEKKEGGYFTGAAGPAASPDAGFGGGILLLYFYNGYKDNPLFAYTPYLLNLAFVANYQSKGLLNLGSIIDVPYIFNTNFRFRSELWYNSSPVTQYFGKGSNTLKKLQDPYGNNFENLSDYNNQLRSINNNGFTDAFYNYYKMKEFIYVETVQRSFSGGKWQILGGLSINHYDISDYSGQKITFTNQTGNKVSAIMNTTRLKSDYQKNLITGFNGGWMNGIYLGGGYDTRDLEPFPRSGMFHDITALFYTPVLGSDQKFSTITTTARFYNSPFSFADLVFAERISYTLRNGNVPFYGHSHIIFTDRLSTSMANMRGFLDQRFIDNQMLIMNFELRYTFFNATAFKQTFDFSFAPFIDTITLPSKEIPLTKLLFRSSYGAGIRITWNQATVICFDYGLSNEGSGLYILIRHIY